MPGPTEGEIREYLDAGNFSGLFRRLGWDNPVEGLEVTVETADSVWVAGAVADKRGVTVWAVKCSEIPPRSVQHQIVKAVKRLSRDQLVVFAAPGEHLWLWPEQRPSGVGHRLVDHRYRPHHGNDALLQRLRDVYFTLAEEPQLTAVKVLDCVRRSFNVEKVTKSFFREFKAHHERLAEHIEGIPHPDDQRWYASVLMNRLMFVYFIQHKGFVAGDRHYLRNRLAMVRERLGADQFYAFFRRFLLPLFHEGLGSPPVSRRYDDPVMEEIIGEVPYVNGGIFEPHRLEDTYDIQIPDAAFEALFEFFDRWRWHLDERPTGDAKEINPDILGFIFEQYVNKKQQGAYYTKPDVTGYMATSAIIPAVADRLVDAGLDDPCVLLPTSGDDYLHDAMSYGTGVPLPEGDLPPSEFPDAELDIALPGERWCDVTHRRKRYVEQKDLVNSGGVADINDAITQNLDLAALMADYFYALVSADECQRAFEVLRSLTVCDPTVGSGAFLLAALDVLDPLYTAVADRAEEIAAAAGGGCPAFLDEARAHHSTRYWLLKTLCPNNLYGVDLMAEAAEIAKLRLFLKLVAQLDDPAHIEPLPDLDFNIKSGNLLVGIADRDDIERRFSDRGVLPFGLEEIEDAVESIAVAYEQFVAIQDSTDDQHVLQQAKGSLRNRIDAVADQADRGLHKMRSETASLEEWKESHAPFHWFIEFPTVWRNNGFDVMIGNPPYIGLKGKKRNQFDYKWIGYETDNCPDLYAVCTERASTLLNDNGRFAMIVMHSLCFHRGFKPLRDHLQGRLSSLWVSSFSRIPDGLFSGSARVRNTIVVGSSRGFGKLFSSHCRRWLSISRPWLFPTQEYTQPSNSLFQCGAIQQWPFVHDPLIAEAFAHVALIQRPIVESVTNGGHIALGYKPTAQYMLGVFVDEPPTVDPATGLPVAGKPAGWLYFEDYRCRDLALMSLAGRWGYLWWLMFGDEFNVTRGVLAALPCDIERLVSESSVSLLTPCDMELVSLVERLLALAGQLKEEMPKHLAWKVNAGLKVGRYNMLKLRHITDEADWLLAQAWGLTREQFEAAGNLRDRMTFGNRE